MKLFDVFIPFFSSLWDAYAKLIIHVFAHLFSDIEVKYLLQGMSINLISYYQTLTLIEQHLTPITAKNTIATLRK